MSRLLLGLLVVGLARGAQLSLHIQAFASTCLYEEGVVGTALQIEYQVVQGAALDIDFQVLDPAKTPLLHERQQLGSFRLDPTVAGEYAICLANEHSSDDKLVYVEVTPVQDLEGDELDALLHPGDSVLDFIETSLAAIRSHLKALIDFQNHHRAETSQHIYLARNINTRIEVWGGIEALMVVLVALGQVFLLRSWFQNPQQINRDASVVILLLGLAIVLVNIPLILAFFSGDNDLHEGFGHRVWEVVAGAVLPKKGDPSSEGLKFFNAIREARLRKNDAGLVVE